MAKIYRFPEIKKAMRQFAYFNDKESRSLLEKSFEKLHAEGMEEADMIALVGDIIYATRLNEGLEK